MDNLPQPLSPEPAADAPPTALLPATVAVPEATPSITLPAVSADLPAVAEQKAKLASELSPLAIAYVRDEDSEIAMLRSFADLGIADGHVVRGNIDTAIKELVNRGAPRFLIVDVAGIEDPMNRINLLAEVCDPTTEVVVIGDRNDIVLYRDMRAAGVAEYFFKPIVSGVMSRVLGSIATGRFEQRTPRTAKLVVAMGVRGGVGATTIATQAAWYLAEKRERRVLLLDLDLQSGDAALQLDAQPSHALREALDHPERVDDLFLDRGIAHVTPRLGLFAALEPLSDTAPPSEAAVLKLLETVMRRNRFVIIDVPTSVALKLPKVLQLATTILLVSDGSLISARETVRWRERIGRNTPERSTLHVLNKKGGDGALPEAEFVRALGQPPDVEIAYDRQVAKSAIMGAKALYEAGAMQSGMMALSRELAGMVAEPPRSIWRRMFG